MSYWETACELLACAEDAVPGFPAYTVPACPEGSNGLPPAFTALPGVIPVLALPQVVFGAPGCPGPLGLGVALAATGTARAIPAAATSASTRFIRPSLLKVHRGTTSKSVKEIAKRRLQSRFAARKCELLLRVLRRLVRDPRRFKDSKNSARSSLDGELPASV